MQWSTKKYRLQQEVPIPRKKVWELLANTDHLNRLIGLFPIRYTAPKFNEPPYYREIHAKVGGLIPLNWKEYPFEWTKNRYYAVERLYSGTVLKRFYGGIELEDAETVLENGERATILKLFSDFTPASGLGVVAIPLVGKQAMKKTLDYCANYLNLAAAGGNNDLPQPSSSSKPNTGTLEARIGKLRRLSIRETAVDKLQQFIRHGGDEEVANMRPYELATRWNEDKDELLRLFLYATKEGLLNLSWEMMCPNCRVSKAQTSTLATLDSEIHCDLCGVTYEADFDRYVELRFSVTPDVRKASRSIFCIGGPFLTPHVFTQSHVKPGESTNLAFPEYRDELRLRVLGSNEILKVDSGGEYREDAAIFSDNGWEKDVVIWPTEGKRLRVENKSGKTIVVVLEKVEWDKLAVTAAKVTAMQEFRDLFSSEVLAPGQQIQIENTTILFSDLKGSTALYEVVGDAHAYSNVRRHFEFLMKWIAEYSGSVVKTMGDAVMAVFYRPEDAVKAAYDIYARLAEFNAELPEDEHIAVKLGIHQGPAIVVNSNDHIDYFGRTVNIASRIQGKSVGDAFVLSRSLFEEKEVSAFLKDQWVHVEPFQAELKGIDEKAELVKVSLKG